MSVIKRIGYTLLFLPVALLSAWIVLQLITEPSHDRDWTEDQTVLPYAEFDGDRVTVSNIRNFSYISTTEYIPDHYDRTFDLNDLINAYYVVEPFSGYKGAAHTLLSFEFENGIFVAVSVEIRKKQGDSFSPWRGLLNQYELMYVIADERDVIDLRANHRNDDVYIYPANASKEDMRAVFVNIMERVNELKESPEFYNTVTNNCTTNIALHANKITPGRVPWNLTMIMPKNSDRYAYQLGLLDVEGNNFVEVRSRYRINERAREYAGHPDFSVKIREFNN